MTQIAAKPQRDLEVESELRESLQPDRESEGARGETLSRLRLLWGERHFLMRTVGVGLVAATLLAFLLPNRYESKTQLMPPDMEQSGGLALFATALSGSGSGQGAGAGASGLSGGLGALAGDLLGLKNTGALFVGVLASRTVQDRIVHRFDLKKVYRARLEETARKKLSANTSIAEERKSGIIALTVTDRDPKRAAAIAAAYVEELDTLMAQLTTSSAHRERVFLDERLKAVNQDLESAEKDFSQFASKNATLDITEQAKTMVTAAATLEGQLIAAQSELEGLKQIYTENNVRVRSTQARITELRHQLEKLAGKAGTAPNGDGTTSDQPYPSLRQLPIVGVPYADLYRRLKVQQAVFETLTQEYELAKVQEAKEIPTVKVLDAPEVPEKRSFPPHLLIMILGTLCVLMLAMVWVLGQARWQEIDPQDPGKLFAQEIFQTVAARVPWLASNGTRWGAITERIASRFGTRNGESEPEEKL